MAKKLSWHKTIDLTSNNNATMEIEVYSKSITIIDQSGNVFEICGSDYDTLISLITE